MVNPLEREPNENERALLETLKECKEQFDVWPIFQYVEAVLYRRETPIDARTVLLECPRISIGPAGIGHYGWVRLTSSSPHTPQPEDVVALTMAGMRHVPSALSDTESFLKVLRYLVAREHYFVPSPTKVQVTEVRFEDIWAELLSAEPRRLFMRDERLAFLADLLRTEPGTWSFPINVPASDPMTWTVVVSSALRVFDGVTDASDYVERVVDLLTPPLQPSTPSYAGLTLPEAIDYLNAVWRIHAGEALVRITRAEAAARLAHDCSSVEEFEADLSALCGLLGQLRLPNHAGDAKLIDLKSYLGAQLDPDGYSRVELAVDDLRRLFDLRAWRQHPGADRRGRSAMTALGLQLPTTQWHEAWSIVQASTVKAITSIREEVDKLI